MALARTSPGRWPPPGRRWLVTARRGDRLAELVREIDGAKAFPCDLAAPVEAEKLARDALAAHGHVDILVNNAGASDAPNRAESESLDDFKRVVDINLNAVFRSVPAARAFDARAGEGGHHQRGIRPWIRR